jgi:hypothetical protein
VDSKYLVRSKIFIVSGLETEGERREIVRS